MKPNVKKFSKSGKSNHPVNHKHATNEDEEYFSGAGSDDEAEPEEAEEEKDDANNENDESNNNEKAKKVKVIVRKPMPKLDSTRLCGERGLKQLGDYFNNFKLKGEGHEFQDLDMMISKYEYWAHRLFPKAKFADVIERLEKLGETRHVKSQLNTIRMGGEQESDANNLLQNQNADALLENQQMTEHVLNRMQNINTHHSDEDDEYENIHNLTEKTGQQRKIQTIQDDEEDEDEILRSLLNV